MCEKVAGYLKKFAETTSMFYADILHENDDCRNAGELTWIGFEEADTDMICLVVLPEIDVGYDNNKFLEKKKELLCRLNEKGVRNFTDYFSHMKSIIKMESEVVQKYGKSRLLPRKIVLGASESMCGNAFFMGLIDNHPSVWTISEYSPFNNNLFWFCVWLSNLPSEKILPFFHKFYPVVCNQELKDRKMFEDKLKTMLVQGEKYTSQELFILFQIAYASMFGKNIDASRMMIYWEPHIMRRENVEMFVEWLGTADCSCDILNIVRNICMVKGAVIKGTLVLNGMKKEELNILEMLSCPDVGEKRCANRNRYTLRFEDIKLHPHKVLTKLCGQWGIPWSDTLLETTKYGKKCGYYNGEKNVHDFDLSPVYNNYEIYFTEFDRFRLALICAPWQRKYEYPFKKTACFSRRELQDMFLKEFRIEAELSSVSTGQKEKLNTEIKKQQWLKEKLWEIRMMEFYETGSGEMECD